MLAYQGEAPSLSLASAMSRAHATVQKSPPEVGAGPTPVFTLLSCPSYSHTTTFFGTGCSMGGGGRRAWAGRQTGAAAWANRDVRVDVGELGCSLDMLNCCHRPAPR